MTRLVLEPLDEQEQSVDPSMHLALYNEETFLMFRNPITMKWTMIDMFGETIGTHTVYRNDLIEEVESILNTRK